MQTVMPATKGCSLKGCRQPNKPKKPQKPQLSKRDRKKKSLPLAHIINEISLNHDAF